MERRTPSSSSMSRMLSAIRAPFPHASGDGGWIHENGQRTRHDFNIEGRSPRQLAVELNRTRRTLRDLDLDGAAPGTPDPTRGVGRAAGAEERQEGHDAVERPVSAQGDHVEYTVIGPDRGRHLHEPRD